MVAISMNKGHMMWVIMVWIIWHLAQKSGMLAAVMFMAWQFPSERTVYAAVASQATGMACLLVWSCSSHYLAQQRHANVCGTGLLDCEHSGLMRVPSCRVLIKCHHFKSCLECQR